MKVRYLDFFRKSGTEVTLPDAVRDYLTDNLTDGTLETARSEIDLLRDMVAELVGLLVDENCLRAVDVIRKLGLNVEEVE